MLDDKLCNTLSETKFSRRCYLCGASSKYFNDLQKMSSRSGNDEFLSFGITVLYSWIRTSEFLPQLAYKLPIEYWRATQESKDIVENHKNILQEQIKKKISLAVDLPKPGYGNIMMGM